MKLSSEDAKVLESRLFKARNLLAGMLGGEASG